MEQRISEAQRLGFKKIIIPSFSKRKSANVSDKIELIQCLKIEEAIKVIFRA
jgi:predicted ATP-dependent serine protease